MAKTPKILQEAIAQYERAVTHTEELIRVKHTVPEENQAQHVRDGFDALWIARLEGQWVLLEYLLHQAKCYAGFMYVGRPKYQLIEGTSPPQYTTARYGVTLQDPDFADWRRVYFTKN